jgi:hypothetical protein
MRWSLTPQAIIVIGLGLLTPSDVGVVLGSHRQQRCVVRPGPFTGRPAWWRFVGRPIRRHSPSLLLAGHPDAGCGLRGLGRMLVPAGSPAQLDNPGGARQRYQ